MKTFQINPDNIDNRAIDTAVRVLLDGQIIIYPTDTIYAMGCDALNSKAIEALCHIKAINPDKQLLSIVCSDIAQAAEYAKIDNRAFKILKEFLPGPFTFILPASSKLPKQFKGRKTVGIRIPKNNIARRLASDLGHPLLSSSVMPEDAADLVSPAALAIDYDHQAALMLDGGGGSDIPSTVVDLTDSSAPDVIRKGSGQFE